MHLAGEKGTQGWQHPSSAAGFGETFSLHGSHSKASLCCSEQISPALCCCGGCWRGKLDLPFVQQASWKGSAQQLVEKHNLLMAHAHGYWVERDPASCTFSPSAGSDSSCRRKGIASPPQRHQPPSAAALLVLEKTYFEMMEEILGVHPLLNQAQGPLCTHELPWLTVDAPLPFSSHQRMSWHILTTHS